MYFAQSDFIKFVLHLDQYLKMDFRFIESDEKTPVAILGNEEGIPPIITLHFNHAKSEAEAGKQWYSRRDRVNKDNLYIILYKLDGVTIDELHQLDDYPFNNKVCLSHIPLPEILWSKYIKPSKYGDNRYSYLNSDIFGMAKYEKKWDFVEFLNRR